MHKELIHPSQFVNCPLLIKEADFFRYPPKNPESLYTLSIWQQPTLQSPFHVDEPLHNHNDLPAQPVPFSFHKGFTVEL
jgi:hypothetical protein